MAADPLAVDFDPQALAKLVSLLTLLPILPVHRSYASGLPFLPQSVAVLDAQQAGSAALTLGAAAVAKQGVSFARERMGQLTLALAVAASAVAHEARLVAVERRTDRAGKVLASGVVVVHPWRAGTPGDADPHRARVLAQARRVIRWQAAGSLWATAPRDGSTYLEDVAGSITLPDEGVTFVGVPALPAVLLTVAVVGAIGLAQYFRASVAKEKLYLEAQNALPLAACTAALQLELERLRQEATTGTKIDPSPLALKIADGLGKRIETGPTPSGGTARIVGGIAGGVALTVGAGLAARHYAVPKAAT